MLGVRFFVHQQNVNVKLFDGILSVTTIEGDNEELKNVYKITKAEKLKEAYSDNN